jgi:hypothetical protein
VAHGKAEEMVKASECSIAVNFHNTVDDFYLETSKKYLYEAF